MPAISFEYQGVDGTTQLSQRIAGNGCFIGLPFEGNGHIHPDEAALCEFGQQGFKGTGLRAGHQSHVARCDTGSIQCGLLHLRRFGVRNRVADDAQPGILGQFVQLVDGVEREHGAKKINAK